jgi:hypothetical protein
VGFLASPDGACPPRDLPARQGRALRQHPPRLLLDRDPSETRLQAKPRGHLVVQIPDHDARHDPILGISRDSVK